MKLRRINFFLFIFIFYKKPLLLLAADEKGGMPQLDPSSFSSQVFWLVVVFTILFVLINSFFMPRITKVHAERSKIINENINIAEKNNKVVEDLNSRIEENISKAKIEAEKIFKVSYEKNMRFFNRTLYQNEITELYTNPWVGLQPLTTSTRYFYFPPRPLSETIGTFKMRNLSFTPKSGGRTIIRKPS